MVYKIPTRRKNQRRRIRAIKQRNKYRFYYGDRDYYRNYYLKTEHWKQLRAEKLKLNPVCEKCGNNERVEPHHLAYKNLIDIQVSDLMTLCRRCHMKVHLHS